LKRTTSLCICFALLLLTLTACATLPKTATPPPSSAVTLEQWAERYPAEYADWQVSVHGVAYLAGNQDAPACTSCHGDPGSGEIQTAAFRLSIPAQCARCHSDEKLMAKAGIPSDTYATYLATYHGATIQYYQAKDTSAQRFEAVCSDCHSAHAIYAPSNARSTVAPAKLLATCQKCHAGAGENFATTAYGHLRTTQAASPVVYFLGLIYKILIPAVIGVMVLYILLDIVHRVRVKAVGGRRP
jgi:hypothetical protein